MCIALSSLELLKVSSTQALFTFNTMSFKIKCTPILSYWFIQFKSLLCVHTKRIYMFFIEIYITMQENNEICSLQTAFAVLEWSSLVGPFHVISFIGILATRYMNECKISHRWKREDIWKFPFMNELTANQLDLTSCIVQLALFTFTTWLLNSFK